MQSCWKHNAKPPTRPPTASQPFHPLLLPAVLHRSFCSCCCWPPNTNRNTSQRDAAPRQMLHPNIANKQSPPAAYVSAGFAMTSASAAAACRTQPATHRHRTHPPAAVWHGAVPLSRITHPSNPSLLTRCCSRQCWFCHGFFFCCCCLPPASRFSRASLAASRSRRCCWKRFCWNRRWPNLVAFAGRLSTRWKESSCNSERGGGVGHGRAAEGCVSTAQPKQEASICAAASDALVSLLRQLTNMRGCRYANYYEVQMM